MLVAVVALALWQFFATVPVFGNMLLPPFFFSNPVDVGSQIVEWFCTASIWKHLLITLWESVLAFVIGSVGGVLVGFWFARQPRVAAMFDPYVKMANALPRVVLAPIFTLWLGLGIWSKVALGVTLVFFIVFFNVYQGVKEVSPTVLDNGRMLGMSERQLMRHVYWPSALSWMFSSLHTVGRLCRGRRGGRRISGFGGGARLPDPAGRRRVRRRRGVRRHVRAVRLRHPDRLVVTLVERRLLVWRPDVDGGARVGRTAVIARSEATEAIQSPTTALDSSLALAMTAQALLARLPWPKVVFSSRARCTIVPANDWRNRCRNCLAGWPERCWR